MTRRIPDEAVWVWVAPPAMRTLRAGCGYRSPIISHPAGTIVWFIDDETDDIDDGVLAVASPVDDEPFYDTLYKPIGKTNQRE